MKRYTRLSRILAVVGIGMLASHDSNPMTSTASAAPAAKPYTILNTAQTMGTGGIDYVHADNDGRRLYVPRGSEVFAFDLDTLKPVGSITNARARGARSEER